MDSINTCQSPFQWMYKKWIGFCIYFISAVLSFILCLGFILHQPLSKEKSRHADSCLKTVFNLLSNNIQYTCTSPSCPFTWTISISTVLINSMECKNRKDYKQINKPSFSNYGQNKIYQQKKSSYENNSWHITVTILLSKLKRKSKSKILFL